MHVANIQYNTIQYNTIQYNTYLSSVLAMLRTTSSCCVGTRDVYDRRCCRSLASHHYMEMSTFKVTPHFSSGRKIPTTPLDTTFRQLYITYLKPNITSHVQLYSPPCIFFQFPRPKLHIRISDIPDSCYMSH